MFRSYICSSLMAVAMLGCTSTMNEDEDITKTEAQKEVEISLASQDVRLLYTAGRRPVIPGFEQADFNDLKAKCGIKLLANSGDVIRTVEEKERRIAQYRFAKEYNQLMYDRCYRK